MGCSPVFSQETVPAAFQVEHALAESRWGVLQVLEGRLRLHGPLSCRVDFFREDDRAGHRTVLVAADDDVKLSFERCETSGDFGKRFYEIFLDSSDEIAPHFAGTDFGKKRKLLRDSVSIMVSRDPRDPTMRDTLQRIGASGCAPECRSSRRTTDRAPTSHLPIVRHCRTFVHAGLHHTNLRTRRTQAVAGGRPAGHGSSHRRRSGLFARDPGNRRASQVPLGGLGKGQAGWNPHDLLPSRGT